MCETTVLSLKLVENSCVHFSEIYCKQEPDVKSNGESVLSYTFPRIQHGTSLFKNIFFFI